MRAAVYLHSVFTRKPIHCGIILVFDNPQKLRIFFSVAQSENGNNRKRSSNNNSLIAKKSSEGANKHSCDNISKKKVKDKYIIA